MRPHQPGPPYTVSNSRTPVSGVCQLFHNPTRGDQDGWSQLWVSSRPEHEQQTEQAYSITSSARTSSPVGTVMPRAFAVLRLTASSYLFGACTGRSAAFSPF